ncbi:TPR repeat-containing protein [Cylindrospermum sp. NIES-4074]|nr:TPR repeat-containing protein [Cylindrospermum sp. NIES-4074]
MRGLKILALLVGLGLTLTPQISVAQTLEELEKQAETAEEAKNYEEAANIWRGLIQGDRQNSYAYIKLANILSSQGKISEAITAYRQALQLSPESPVYEEFGDFLAEKGRIQEAIAAYRQALQLNPKNPTIHVSLANHLLGIGDTEAALAAYRQAVAIEPNTSHYNFLAEALFKLGKREEAIAAYRQALMVSSQTYQSSEIYSKLGEILEYPEAVAMYQQVSKNGPKNESFYGSLAELSFKRGYVDEAIANYKQLIQLQPDATNYTKLGDALIARKNYTDAIAAYRQAVTKDPSDYYYSQLSSALAQQGNLDEAVAICQQVVKMGEGSYDTCSTLNLPLYKKKGFAGVMAFYQQLANNIPQRQLAALYIQLGENIAYNEGSKQEAVAAIRKGLQLDPGNADAKSTLEYLLSN